MGTMKTTLLNWVTWAGTVALILAPFQGDRLEYWLIAGFSFLIPQAIDKGAWNLVLLNSFGVVSYLWRIL